MMVNEINLQFKAHAELVRKVEEQLTVAIIGCVALLVDALRTGNKILTMGNGGSAADAQHFAAEMIGRFMMERKALPSIALTTDTSILTAVGNDYGFEEVFTRQVEALTNPGDVIIGISTSGNSKNVKRALESGKRLGAKTVGLLGRDGGEIGPIVDLELTVPSSETPRVQESHLIIIHILCDLVEKGLFGASND